jgi:hypothetical protein
MLKKVYALKGGRNMIINKVYPHVNVTTTALVRNPGDFIDTGATSLFVPFLAEKGLSDEIQKIFNLTQFISEYGEPDFSYQGRSILNIYNWLNAGGSIYALRLVGEGGANSTGSLTVSPDTIVTFTAKSKGTYYDDLKVILKNSIYTNAVDYIDAEIYLDNKRVQTVYKLSAENFQTVLTGTQWFGSIVFGEGESFTSLHTLVEASDRTIEFAGGDNGIEDLDRLVRHFFYRFSDNITVSGSPVVVGATGENLVLTLTSSVGLNIGESLKISRLVNEVEENVIGQVTSINGASVTIQITSKSPSNLSALAVDEWFISEISTSSITAQDSIANKLEFPIDMIMDAGFELNTKQAIHDFTKQVAITEEDNTILRNDIIVIFDQFDFSSSEVGEAVSVSSESFNHAVYTQKITINDIVSGKDVWVTPTYFLASLIPANDNIYGLQWPTAGLTRGVLQGVKILSKNPTEQEKQDFYKARLNYIEKDSRGFYFMSQLTNEPGDTSLRFLNNSRVTLRIAREIENLGRDYLFEFNDTATLNNLRNALNRYINGWIQNRTLSFGSVDVFKSERSDERVDVKMNIRFTGTIEIISVDITIE